MAKFQFKDVALEVPDVLLNEKLTQKMATGQYEFHEARAARLRVKPGQRVLELGGGVGYISSICAQITDAANIVTVEANPVMIDVIRHNLDLNGAAAARLVHGAVVGDGADGETLLFRVGRAFWGASIANAADGDSDTAHLVEVPMICLSVLLESHQPDVVIMDIEGAEKYLFDSPWPRFVNQVLMELHPRQYPDSTIQKIVDCMSQSGLTYDPGASRGALLSFRRVRDLADARSTRRSHALSFAS